MSWSWNKRGGTASFAVGIGGRTFSMNKTGDVVVVGNPSANAVNIYTYNGTNWILGAAILGATISNTGNFGYSVDVNYLATTANAIIAVGAPNAPAVAPSTVTGKVFVYSFNGTSATQLGNTINWVNPSTNVGTMFGKDLKLTGSGTSLVVTADFRARVYTLTSNIWVQKGTNLVSGSITTGTVTNGECTRVSISDNAELVISGVPNLSDTNLTSRIGRIRLHKLISNDWTTTSVSPDVENAGPPNGSSYFGYGVDIHPSGSHVAATYYRNGSSCVRIYTVNNVTSGELITFAGSVEIVISSNTPGGRSVSLNGDSTNAPINYMLAVGSPEEGKVDFFVRNNTTWFSPLNSTIINSDPPSTEGPKFGANVVVAGEYLSNEYLGVGSQTNANVYESPTICFHKSAKVLTKQGSKQIHELREGDIVYDNQGNAHNISKLVKLPTNTKYVLIKKDAISVNMPNEDLYISEFHPVYINGEEIIAKLLVNGETITKVTIPDDKNMYTILTSERKPININGLYAMTWKDTEFYDYASKRLISYQFY